MPPSKSGSDSVKQKQKLAVRRGKTGKSPPGIDVRSRVCSDPSQGRQTSSLTKSSGTTESRPSQSSSSHKHVGGSHFSKSGATSSQSGGVTKPSSFDITVHKLSSKTTANVKEALIRVRKRYIKEENGVERFRQAGGLSKLMSIINSSQASTECKDIALSILGNCCMDL